MALVRERSEESGCNNTMSGQARSTNSRPSVAVAAYANVASSQRKQILKDAISAVRLSSPINTIFIRLSIPEEGSILSDKYLVQYQDHPKYVAKTVNILVNWCT